MKTFRAPALLGLCAIALAGCNTTGGPNELALSRPTDAPIEMAAHMAAVEVPAATSGEGQAQADQTEAAKTETGKTVTEKPATKRQASQHAATGQHGLASWYQLRGRTACGNINNPSALTAAHRTLPCGTRVLVTNLRNGKSVHVTITDRGPFAHRRIVDVSRAAAHQIGLIGAGIAPVSVARVN